MLISAKRVEELLGFCLYKDNELIDGKPIVPYIPVEGVAGRLGFHPDRLLSIKSEVEEMISNLPPEIDSIEGLSFLGVCEDKENNQWTGLHKTCDELVMLGVGLDLIEYTLPRPFWMICPGGVPMIRKKYPSDPSYKDMSKNRNGRERSDVVQAWLREYKQPFMKGLLGDAKTGEEILTVLRSEFKLNDESGIASAVAEYTVLWLDSDTGREFLSKAFGVEIPLVKVPVSISEHGKEAYKEILGQDLANTTVSKVHQVWGDYRQNVMSNIIYRTDANRDSITEEIWKAVNYGSPETAEIVVDTMIGWLNSHVGRSFVRDAFEVSIPTLDPKGSE